MYKQCKLSISQQLYHNLFTTIPSISSIVDNAKCQWHSFSSKYFPLCTNSVNSRFLNKLCHNLFTTIPSISGIVDNAKCQWHSFSSKYFLLCTNSVNSQFLNNFATTS